MIWNDHHLDDRVKTPYPKSNPGLCEQPSISSSFAQRLLDGGDCGRLHEMQGGRSFWTKNPVIKILFLHNNGLLRWSTSRLEFQTLWHGEEPSRPGFFQGVLRRRWAKSIVGQSWTRMLRDILGEEQEDPACLWIQQVNTEGGHRNIEVRIIKNESLTNSKLILSSRWPTSRTSAFLSSPRLRRLGSKSMSAWAKLWSVRMSKGSCCGED